MKNIQKLVSEGEVTEYTDNLWQTDTFKESSQTPGSLIHGVTERFAKHPRLFFEYTDPKLEKYHFVNSFNMVPRRQGWYQEGEGTKWNSGAAIEDLFYLHEIYHVIERDFVVDISFEKWVQRWYENETSASLMSEVAAYFHLPGLREQTFKGEIWADRLLDNRRPLSHYLTQDEESMESEYPENNQEFFAQDPAMFNVFLTRARMSILLSEKAAEDKIELGISKWLGRNLEYYKCWRGDFLEIENQMAIFHASSRVNRAQALDALVRWLEEKKGDKTCLFQNVAEDFNTKIRKTRKSTRKKVAEESA